ncbi:MAG: hypothetical protein ACJ8C4_19345 [Gemmataceae bacterium]
MKIVLATLLAASLPLAFVSAEVILAPPVTISLSARHGHVVPAKQGFCHTGGGNIDVVQPGPDVVIITMSGVAVAGGHPCKDSIAAMNFELEQCFDVAFANPSMTKAKLTLEGRVVGALRSHKNGGGSAQEGPGLATIVCGNNAISTLATDPHSVSCGNSLSVNCRTAPVSIVVTGGRATLHQSWNVSANNPQSILPCKAASAEFAPDPALDPLWISYWEPFHGAIKKDFGFQVIMKVEPDNTPTPAVR